jgi:transcriptional regulator with XRE-family HTH domain
MSIMVSYRSREDLAQRVREIREERGLKQGAVADALGIDKASMSRLETGERGMSTGELVSLAALFGVRVDDLVCADEPACALRASCADDAVEAALECFDEVIEDYFTAEALAR